MLRDVSAADTTATFLGRKVRLPVMLAPVGGMESFAPEGAAAAARAAAQFGVPQMLSSVCQPGLEATAAAADTLRVFQLYVRGDDAWVDDWGRRAREHGFSAFCFTVDSASYSRRERDLVGRFVKPWRANAAAGMKYQAALSWDQVKRFKDRHDLPMILKGIATVEDAEIAVRHGVQVIYVSNHGGRQLDHGLGSAAVLPEIVAAVGGRAEVWVDGGFMRGSDVVKAIALGARCVGLGRLTCLGLAAAGVPGLVRALELLEEEIRICLMLLGVTSLAELTPAHLAAAPPVRSRRRSARFRSSARISARLVEDQPHQRRRQRRHVGDQQQHQHRRGHERDERARDRADAGVRELGGDEERPADRRRVERDREVRGHHHAEVDEVDVERLGERQEERRGQQQRRQRLDEDAEQEQRQVHEQQEHPLLMRDRLDPLGELHRHLLGGQQPRHRGRRAEHEHHHRARLERAEQEPRQVAPGDVAVQEERHGDAVDDRDRRPTRSA